MKKDILKANLKAADLFKHCIGMQTFSRVIHVCHYALMAQDICGDIVELGCHRGNIAKILSYITNKKIYVYDSFEGLPKNDEGHKENILKTSVQLLVQNFRKDNIKTPIIRKSFFENLTEKDMPEKISFAHLDGDLYTSIKQSLKLVYNKMSINGIILIDDYGHSEWQGVKKAVDEFFTNKPETVVNLPGINNKDSHKALIIKK